MYCKYIVHRSVAKITKFNPKRSLEAIVIQREDRLYALLI